MKRPTPAHAALIQTQHQETELCPSKNLSLRQVLATVSTTIQKSNSRCLCLRSCASNGRAKTADGQIQASVPGDPPCFMALLRALPNRSETLESDKNATSLMSWSRLSDPSYNWTSAHFGITWNGSEKGKFFDEKKKRSNDEKKSNDEKRVKKMAKTCHYLTPFFRSKMHFF